MTLRRAMKTSTSAIAPGLWVSRAIPWNLMCWARVGSAREELLVFPREELRHARSLKRLEDWLAGKAYPLEVVVRMPAKQTEA